jgi:TRAP-type mannitol/chloroaromatic compound transport system permease large subunit
MFDVNTAIAILLGSFFVLTLIRVPICFVLAFSTALTMFYADIPLMALVQQMSKAINSFSLMAIPFFILAGEIMGVGGIADRMLNFRQRLSRPVPRRPVPC